MSYPENIKNFINGIINNISVNTNSVCETSVNNSQIISFSDLNFGDCNVIFEGVSNSIKSNITAECFQSNNFSNLLNSAIEFELNKIKPTLKDGDYDTLKNTFTNSVVLDSISSCSASSANSQLLEFTGLNALCPPVIVVSYDSSGNKIETTMPGTFILKNFTNAITSNVVTKCIQDNNKITETLTALKDIVPIVPEPITPTNNKLSSGTIIGIVSGVCVVIIIMIILFVAVGVNRHKLKKLRAVQ